MPREAGVGFIGCDLAESAFVGSIASVVYFRSGWYKCSHGLDSFLMVGFAVIPGSHPGLLPTGRDEKGRDYLAPLAVDQHIADVIVGDVPVGAQVQGFW